MRLPEPPAAALCLPGHGGGHDHAQPDRARPVVRDHPAGLQRPPAPGHDGRHRCGAGGPGADPAVHPPAGPDQHAGRGSGPGAPASACVDHSRCVCGPCSAACCSPALVCRPATWRQPGSAQGLQGPGTLSGALGPQARLCTRAGLEYRESLRARLSLHPQGTTTQQTGSALLPCDPGPASAP